MFVDVANPDIHRLYARALARTGHQISAIFEYNSAILCKPEPDDLAQIYEDMAVGYDKLKQPEHAKQAREYAKQVKATSPKGKGDDDDDDDIRGGGKPKPRPSKPKPHPDDEGT
jgi:cellulose synthase operon protein C